MLYKRSAAYVRVLCVCIWPGAVGIARADEVQQVLPKVIIHVPSSTIFFLEKSIPKQKRPGAQQPTTPGGGRLDSPNVIERHA